MKKFLKIILILVAVIAISAIGFYSYISINGIPRYPNLVKDPAVTINKSNSLMLI
jgi:flagellar basal body-associated protein FliL